MEPAIQATWMMRAIRRSWGAESAGPGFHVEGIRGVGLFCLRWRIQMIVADASHTERRSTSCSACNRRDARVSVFIDATRRYAPSGLPCHEVIIGHEE